MSQLFILFIQILKLIFKKSWQHCTQEQLSKEVLAEIPDQLLGYMKSKGFPPPPKPEIYPDLADQRLQGTSASAPFEASSEPFEASLWGH